MWFAWLVQRIFKCDKTPVLLAFNWNINSNFVSTSQPSDHHSLWSHRSMALYKSYLFIYLFIIIKLFNILIYGLPFYVITYRSYKLLKMIQFLAHRVYIAGGRRAIAVACQPSLRFTRFKDPIPTPLHEYRSLRVRGTEAVGTSCTPLPRSLGQKTQPAFYHVCDLKTGNSFLAQYY